MQLASPWVIPSSNTNSYFSGDVAVIGLQLRKGIGRFNTFGFSLSIPSQFLILRAVTHTSIIPIPVKDLEFFPVSLYRLTYVASWPLKNSDQLDASVLSVKLNPK